MTNSPPPNANDPKAAPPSKLGVGLALGIAVGTALGSAMGNPAIGAGIGVAIGVGLGLAWSSLGNQNNDKK